MNIKESLTRQELILTKRQVKDFIKEVSEDLKVHNILCLKGELGAGKTFFASNLIKHLCDDDSLNVISPTFNIMNTYYRKDGSLIHHFDLYRIKNFEELENIGFFDAISNGICIIEWWNILGDDIKKFLHSVLYLNIMYLDEKQRKFYYGK